MLMIPPTPITDANLVTSNITDELPYSTSAQTYDQWGLNVAYGIGNVVCLAGPVFGGNFGQGGHYESYYQGYGSGQDINETASFNVWHAVYAGMNLKPGSFRLGDDGSYPGYWAWALDKSYPYWHDYATYSKGMIVGQISGGVGIVYQSLQDGNTNHAPASSPTYWRAVSGSTYATYSAGTTYASGDRVSILYGTRGRIFESLQSANVGHPPETSPTWWEFKGEGFKTYDSTATYAANDIVSDPQTHSEYASVQDNNTGHALTDEAWWTYRQATNRWRMFDAANSSQSVFGDEIDVTVKIEGLSDCVGLMNITAATVQVIATDDVDGEVFNETYDMESTAGIHSWYDYFFEPILRPSDFLAVTLPNYAGLIIRVIASDPGNLVGIGSAVFGKSREFGFTVLGADLGIHDFSRKEQDDFGNWQIVPRTFSKTTDIKVVCEKDKVDMIHQLLSLYRAQPALYVASDFYAASWAYGYYRDFSVEVAYSEHSYLNLKIESLT